MTFSSFSLLMILEAWLIVCLELKFLILFLFFFLSWGFSFTLSAIVSCDKNRIDNGDDDDPGLTSLKWYVLLELIVYSSVWYDMVARHLFLGSWVHGHLPLILYLAFLLAHFKLKCPPDLYYDSDS